MATFVQSFHAKRKQKCTISDPIMLVKVNVRMKRPFTSLLSYRVLRNSNTLKNIPKILFYSHAFRSYIVALPPTFENLFKVIHIRKYPDGQKYGLRNLI